MKTEFLISTPGFVGFPVEPITVFPTAGLFTVIWALLLATSVIEFVALSESTAFTITELGLPLLSCPIAVMALFPLSLPPVTEVGVYSCCTFNHYNITSYCSICLMAWNSTSSNRSTN